MERASHQIEDEPRPEMNTRGRRHRETSKMSAATWDFRRRRRWWRRSERETPASCECGRERNGRRQKPQSTVESIKFINLICAITIALVAVGLLPTAATAIESDSPTSLARSAELATGQTLAATTTRAATTTPNSSSNATTSGAMTTTAMPPLQPSTLSTVLRRDLSARVAVQQSDQQQQQQLPSLVQRHHQLLQTATINANTGQDEMRRGDGVCQVKGGESVAIMEIEESRGLDASQTMQPAELPIGGSVALGEIELKIESETHKYFQIKDKSLRLTRPLDRDATLKEISCVDKRQQASNSDAQPSKKTIIPVLVKVLDLNDNAPKFSQPVYSVQVNELAPVGTVILDQIAYAIDLDSANNGRIEYSLLGAQPVVSSSVTPSVPILPASKSVVPAKLVSSAAAVASQRLVQRAEPPKSGQEKSTQTVPQPTTVSGAPGATVGSAAAAATTTTTTTTTTATVDASSSSPTSNPAATSSQLSTTTAVVASTTSEPVGRAVSGAEDAPSSNGPTETTTRNEDDENEDESSSTGAPTGPPKAGAPTINLDSEPIQNGPMDDSEEDESDESLLATINGASSTNTTDTDGGEQQPAPSQPAGDQSDFASVAALRAYLPRWGKLTASSSAQMPRQLRLKRTRRQLQDELAKTRRQAAAATEATAATAATATVSLSSTRAPRPGTSPSNQPPWTNLMVIPGEEFRSLEALSDGPLVSAKLQDSSNEDQDRDQAQSLDRSYSSSSDLFELELSPLTSRPVIKLKRQLDYETERVHQLTLVATDRAQNKQERLSSQVKIIVRVLDGDDQPPAFILDQGGCATGLVTQATSPLPPMLAQPTPPTAGVSSNATADLLQQEASVDSSQSVHSQWRLSNATGRIASRSTVQPGGEAANARLRSFKVTDENFDFGDTLGLDDVPLDQEPGVGDDERALSTPASGVHSSPARRLMAPMAGAPMIGPKSQTPAGSNQLLDYLCLATSGAKLPAKYEPGQQQQQQQLAEYFATVISGDSDYLLRVAPQTIKARDRDELNAPIRYSFINGTPSNYSHYFQINPLDASIKQVAPAERAQVSEFTLFIRAQEQSYNKLFSLAKLTIDVLPTDKSPPVLVPNAYAGFVNENSPIGSRVLVQVDDGSHLFASQQMNSTTGELGLRSVFMRIAVLDADKGASSGARVHERSTPPTSAESYGAKLSTATTISSTSKQVKYEFETTSDAFKIDRDGFVFVNRFPLDRDQPGQAVHMFQVTARQVGLVSSRSISSPVSLNITLLDLNDNPPQLVNSTLGPIQMAASTRGGARQLIRLEALDRDLAENSQMQFSIQHVSNMGAARFRIDEESGRIEALGKFQAGEQFSLTVQVADELGRSSQGILDVQVVPGANTGGPQFLADSSGGGGGSLETRSRQSDDHHHHLHHHHHHHHAAAGTLSRAGHYSVEVSEGVAVNSAILQVRAIDPENDPISFSLIDGNINNDFSINSKTGTLTVANKLDREEISAYKLIVQARDSGGLATSRPIHVSVIDLNDQNPVFSQDQYVFSVEEGVPTQDNATTGGSHQLLLGRVSAHDSDEGENGRVTYSLIVLDSVASGLTSGGAPYASASLELVVDGELDGGRVRGVANKWNGNKESRLFSINATTGEIKLERPLDYEQAKSHTLLVVAQDHGENPRSSSAMVQVRVLDRQDEPPYFERYHLEARLDENQPNQRVGLVQARDPDSVAEITYVLIAGDSSLFQVDSQTGLITTTGLGLDYEQARLHTLLIGTNESLAGIDLAEVTQRLSDAIASKQVGLTTGGQQQQQQQQLQQLQLQANLQLERSPVVRVDVSVVDLNDNAPSFESGDLMLPVRVQDSAALGSALPVRVRAHDSDGSAPNNQIRYELVTQANVASSKSSLSYSHQFTSDRCAQLFLVDPSGGQISVRADLKRDAQSECQLVIRARDSPVDSQSSLSSQVSLTVYIDHLIELSTSSMVAFADSSYTVELLENAPGNTLVRLLTIINKPRVAFPMSCEIISGNELGKFYVLENEARDCELRTRDSSLDYEQRQRYTLVVRLNTVGGGGGGGGGGGSSSSRSALAQVQVNILDLNDNKPAFAGQPPRYSQLTQGKYLAAIAHDSPPETQLIQLRATDLDSSQANGLVSYELLNEPELEGHFRVEPVDGIVRTSRPVEDIPATRLPIKLRVLARDNPERPGDSQEALAEVVVNLIDDRHRIALVLKDTPASRVLDSKEELLAVLQERTGLISGLERVESLKIQRNLSLTEADISGSDVWFYLIEPGSLRIVPSDDPRLKSSLFEARAQNSLADVIAQSLGLAARARVRLPYALTNAQLAGGQLSGNSPILLFGAIRADSSDRLASTLILISLFIAVISAIVVIYQCGSVAGLSESATASQQLHSHQQHFAKEKFLFSPPPPPPPASHYQFAGSTFNGDLMQTPFDSLSRSIHHGHHEEKYALARPGFGPAAAATIGGGGGGVSHASNTQPSTPYALGPASRASSERQQQQQQQQLAASNKDLASRGGFSAKEYETQMLKMSVLFDDSQSFDDQNHAS